MMDFATKDVGERTTQCGGVEWRICGVWWCEGECGGESLIACIDAIGLSV